jgi:hypothetical protein
MESMRAHFERESGAEGAWTSYNASLGRPLLNTAKFLEKRSATPATSGAKPDEDGQTEDTPRQTGLEVSPAVAPETEEVRSSKA